MDVATVVRTKQAASRDPGRRQESAPQRSADGLGRSAARYPVVTSAELAECTCPDACLRDHGNE